MRSLREQVSDYRIIYTVCDSITSALSNQIEDHITYLYRSWNYLNYAIDKFMTIIALLLEKTCQKECVFRECDKNDEKNMCIIKRISKTFCVIIRTSLTNNKKQQEVLDEIPSNIFKICTLYRYGDIDNLQQACIGCVILQLISIFVEEKKDINPLIFYSAITAFSHKNGNSHKSNLVGVFILIIVALVTNNIEIMIERIICELRNLESVKLIRLLFEVLLYMVKRDETCLENPHFQHFIKQMMVNHEIYSNVDSNIRELSREKRHDPLDKFVESGAFVVIDKEYSGFASLVQASIKNSHSLDPFTYSVTLYQLVSNRNEKVGNSILFDVFKKLRCNYLLAARKYNPLHVTESNTIYAELIKHLIRFVVVEKIIPDVSSKRRFLSWHLEPETKQIICTWDVSVDYEYLKEKFASKIANKSVREIECSKNKGCLSQKTSINMLMRELEQRGMELEDIYGALGRQECASLSVQAKMSYNRQINQLLNYIEVLEEVYLSLQQSELKKKK